jgi:carbonic anhydrase
MNKYEKFGTAISCIDGRVQGPVADWIKLHYQVQYVDMITEPGVDRILSHNKSNRINSIAEKLHISIHVHQSSLVAIVGHFDCAANDISIEEHLEEIKKGVKLVYSWNLGVRVIGLYVTEWNSVDLICDSDTEFKEMRSYL